MRILTATFAALVLIGCSKNEAPPVDLMAREVTFPNGTVITAVPAQSQMEILQGLHYYDKLPQDRGMLFIYAKPEKHPFWTYNAKFPVDIIWIDRDFRIVEISPNTPPCLTQAHECPTYGGMMESRYVLAVNAGIAAKNQLRVGEKLSF